MTERLATGPQVSEYLKVPEGTLARWRYEKKGPTYFRVGRHVRYRMSDVERWLADQRAGRK